MPDMSIAGVTARINQILALGRIGAPTPAPAAGTAAPPVATAPATGFATELDRARGPVPAGAGGDDARMAADIDAWIARRQPDSPLRGHGAVFVQAGRANGMDPRLLVAIAAQESALGTAGSGRGINNPFGWGPAIPFESWSSAITTVAGGLARGYLAEGRDTIAAIQGKWAPVGASNDPGGLNGGWAAGVARLYADLGGDPAASVRTA